MFERYLVEVVEKYDFCPWARGARDKGEMAVEVVWGTPTVEAWVTAAAELLGRPGIVVAMVIAPELSITASELHGVRGEVAARIATAGVAEFHPLATLDLVTPARLVPFVRRSPDPLLQLVPLDEPRPAREAGADPQRPRRTTAPGCRRADRGRQSRDRQRRTRRDRAHARRDRGGSRGDLRRARDQRVPLTVITRFEVGNPSDAVVAGCGVAQVPPGARR